MYRETTIICDMMSDPIMCKINMTRIVTRATIYQWVTNLVNSTRWSYAWISQSISTLLAANVIDNIYFLFFIYL